MDLPRDFEILRPLLTKERLNRLDQCLSRRTRRITVVLDDLYHRHNMSAVVRSCEAFGVQDIHVIELSNPFSPSRGVALGAEQWITIKKYKSIGDCVEALRRSGYRIMCADPPGRAEGLQEKACYPIADIPMEAPLALVFGRERDGLHEEIRQLCDARFYIPMLGLTESLNVSVTVGITLHELRSRLEKEVAQDKWGLSGKEKLELLDLWAVRSLKRGKQVLDELKQRMMKAKKQCGHRGGGRTENKAVPRPV